MYIAVVPNRNSPPAVLLREGWCEGNKTRQRTLANLSDWPAEKIETFRRLLRDEPLVSPQDLFTTQKTLPHGHVEAVLEMIARLKLDQVISAQPCRERDLVLAMIVQRLIDPYSKLATTRQWHSTTLAGEMGVAEANEDDLYHAIDWLLQRQEVDVFVREDGMDFNELEALTEALDQLKKQKAQVETAGVEKQIKAVAEGTQELPGLGLVNRDLGRLLFGIESADQQPSAPQLQAVEEQCKALTNVPALWKQLNDELAKKNPLNLPVDREVPSSGCAR